jgi:Zn-finger nucleic acid-binding protein
VRCAHCFRLNVPDNVCCAGCGRDLGLEPIGDAASVQLACPGCRQALEPFRGGPGRLWDCAGCGGQFVEHALLRELLERREVLGRAVPYHVQPDNPLRQPIRYVPCPACEQLMHRRNFGRSSGIIVDICHPHGTWFDSGELPRVLAFVQRGGLEKARLLERDEQRARQNARSSAPLAVDSTSITGDTSLLGDLADALNALLDFVTSLVRR